MKTPTMIATELRRLFSSRMSVIALFALLLVPVIYGGLYLWANQNPYGKFSSVPVALVVQDSGIPASGSTPAVNYGNQLAHNLQKGHSFHWERMTASQAATALHDGKVDFTVTVPNGYSAALTSVAGATPHQARIDLETNDANNYLASSIGAQAVEEIRTTVAQTVGQQAAARLLLAISDIRGNLVTAATAAAQLVDGTAQAAAGADNLAAGAGQLADGAQQVANGAQQVAAGTQKLASAVNSAGVTAQQAANLLPSAQTNLVAALQRQGMSPAQISQVLAQLSPVNSALQAKNAQLQGTVGQIDQLAAGANQVAAGASRVAASSNRLAAGATSLANGLDSLNSGAARLRDGLQNAVTQIPASTPALRAAQAGTIANPLAVKAGKVASAANYGSGLAPFFAALAAWIGIYALFLIVKPVSRRAVTALRSPVRVTIGGWLTPALLGAVQMVALFGVLALALGFSFTHPVGTLGVMVMASFTYAAIILALNVWLGSVGQFIGLVLMVLQLVTAGGTFPWQTLPGPLAVLHQALPMGYVVDAMRQLMYGGDLARAGEDILVLLVWLLGGLLVAAIGVTRMTGRRTLRDLQPSLIG